MNLQTIKSTFLVYLFVAFLLWMGTLNRAYSACTSSGSSPSTTVVCNALSSGSYTNLPGTIDSITIDSGAVATSISNEGTINAILSPRIAINNSGGNVSSITNISSILAANYGIQNTSSSLILPATIGSILNSGTISTSNSGIFNNSTNSVISNIVNTGTITGAAYAIINYGNISTITNTGTLTGTSQYSIYNRLPNTTSPGPTISNINNLQNNLSYRGFLPTNYNIILGSSSSAYGKLVYTPTIGISTVLSNFGVHSGAVSSQLYTGVLSGITGVTNGTSGSYAGYSYQLVLQSGSTTVWDLLFSAMGGPSLENTQASVAGVAQVLQSTFALQNSVIANSFSYDCTVFGENNICVSAGGRNTAVQAANGLNNTSALLIAAYRALPSVRIGAYADQNLSVNNAGSTVNLGNNTPLIGLFAAWNERQDGTGSELKISAAYGQKNTTINRGVVGSGSTASEAVSGSSQLNSQGFQILGKHGFIVMQDVVVSPYVGFRYTQNNMGGYTEGTSATVTAPLTYSALNTNATTVLAGVGASYKVIPAVTTFASAGVETDTNTATGSYSGTSSSISGLTPVNFNATPVKTRPTAMLGAYYDIEKNQRLGITGIYRQEAYQAVSTTTVMATYTIGL